MNSLVYGTVLLFGNTKPIHGYKLTLCDAITTVIAIAKPLLKRLTVPPNFLANLQVP